METKTNYSSAYVTSLILNNKTLGVDKLNELYPEITLKQFAINRSHLQKKGLVEFQYPISKIKKANSLNGYDREEIVAIIKDNLSLTPKQLHKLVPDISWQTFNGIRHYLPEIVLQRLKKNHLKKNSKYIEKNFESKDEIRKIVAKRIFESCVYGVIPVLPHFDWLGEVAINQLIKNNYYLGIANDMDVFKGASIQKELLGINGTMVFGDMHDILTKYKSNSFAHIGMDFCGVLPNEILTLEYAMQNDLVQVGGYMFLTVTRTVRKIVNGYAKEFMSYVNMNTPETKMTNSEFANDKMIKARFENNDKYVLVDEIPYDTDSQMMFYSIKRVK
jgi:hypothetical protein